MTAIEDRLRAATNAIAQTVDDIAPPLQLRVPVRTPDRGRVSPPHLPAATSGPRRSLPPARRWLPAAAAVVAVLAVAAVLVALAGGLRPGRPARPAGARPLAQLPPYYVALRRLPGPSQDIYRDEAVVRSSAGGQDVAVVTVPKGYQNFMAVSGSDTGLTFVLSADVLSSGPPAGGSKLYLLRVRPSARPGHRAVLSPLAAAALPAGDLTNGFALSADGRMLAVPAERPGRRTPGFILEVYNLATGAHRSWANPGDWQQVSWAANDRTLALEGPQLGHLTLLDTAAPGTTIAADARAVTLRTQPGTQLISGYFGSVESSFGSGTMTADGEHVLEMVSSQPGPSGNMNRRAYGADVLDLRTGTIARLLRRVPMYDILWSNPSGSAALVSYAPLSNPLNSPLKDLTKPTYAVLRSAHGTTRVEIPPATWEVAW
jgi:hypothetical protein